MSDLPETVFYGASGHGRAVAHVLALPVARPPICEVIAFIDDFRTGEGQLIAGRPVIGFEEWRTRFRDVPCFIAVGSGKIRRTLANRISASGGVFCRYYDALPDLFPEVSIGVGSAITPGVYVGTNTVLGEHVHILPMASIGHDVMLADYVTIAPSASISGYVHVHEAAFVGVGATVVPGRADRPLTIGAGAIVAAGAVVTKSVPPGAVVAGNPARPLRDLASERRRSARQRP